MMSDFRQKSAGIFCVFQGFLTTKTALVGRYDECREVLRGCQTLFSGKIVLADAAKRTNEIVGKIFELGAGSDAVIGIADCFVVLIAANVADIFHLISSFRYNILLFYSKIRFLSSLQIIQYPG